MLGTTYKAYQLLGSGTIVAGAIVASADYLFNGDGSGGDDVSTGTQQMGIAAAVVLYFVSMIPSGFSNIYKENQMKINDMHEVHTSTIVSFWQLIVGFLFLPMLRFQALGGLSKYDEYCIALYCMNHYCDSHGVMCSLFDYVGRICILR